MALTKVSRGLLSTGIVDNSNATAITIDSSENVGIGTSSPSSALHVDSSNDGPIFDSGGTGNTNHALLVRDSANNQLLRVNNNGNVGIGVSSLNNPLEVAVTPNTTSKTSGSAFDGAAIRLSGNLSTTNSESAIIAGLDGGIQAGIGFMRESISTWGSAIKFYTRQAAVVDLDGVAERMRIDSSGLLLHGTSTQLGNGWANHKFDGTVYNGLNLQTTRTALNSTFQVFLNSAGAVAGTILHNGTTTVNYGTSSDQRLKENILDSDDSGSTIDAIKIRKFDWIDGGAHEKYGFIAQELNNVVPNAVSGTGLPDDENPMLCVDPSKLVALAIKEIQMLRARVAELENN